MTLVAEHFVGLEQDEQATSVSAPVSGFQPSDRAGLIVGATAIGAVAGIMGTLAIGQLEPWVGVACAAPLLLLALHLANETMQHSLRAKYWFDAALAMLPLCALAAWPVVVRLSTPDTLVFWAAPLVAIVSLATLAGTTVAGPRPLYRTCGAIALVALLATNQGMLVFMGS